MFITFHQVTIIAVVRKLERHMRTAAGYAEGILLPREREREQVPMGERCRYRTIGM
jgi:hypothetical protein